MKPRFIAGTMRLGVLLALWGAILPMRAEDQSTSPAPQVMLRNFYQWYVREAVADRDVFSGDRKELMRYVSRRLLREIDATIKEVGGLNEDYFFDAQDFDKGWARNITVSALVLKGDRGTALVTLKGTEMSRKLRINLVQEKGAWKVDKVQGQE